jgi:hypothetical protein
VGPPHDSVGNWRQTRYRCQLRGDRFSRRRIQARSTRSSGRAAGCTCTSAPAAATRREARRPCRFLRSVEVDGLRRPRSGGGGYSAPTRTRAGPPAQRSSSALLRRDGRPSESSGLAAARSFGVVGRSWHGSKLQDSSGSSTACCRVVSLQLTSGGSSSQCAPVRPSSARWNDMRNDIAREFLTAVSGTGAAERPGSWPALPRVGRPRSLRCRPLVGPPPAMYAVSGRAPRPPCH